MDATAMTCGEALMRLLAAYGVDTVFGIPGVHTLELYKGIAAAGIRHVGVRHEQGAGFMADGYARISGRPGVCVLITGPGVTNAATAMAEAYADSSRVLLISSVNATGDLGLGRGELHELTSQQAVTAPFTGMSATALRPDEVPELIARAFALFGSARPRPAHVAVPIDVLAQAGVKDLRPRCLPSPPSPSTSDVERAASLLGTARRPVMLVGGGAQGCPDAVRRLAERLGAPVVQTRASKGVLTDDHPLSLGATIRLPGTRRILESADVTVAIATEIASTDHWQPRLAMGGKLVRIDLDPTALVRDYPAEAVLHGDAGVTIAALLAALGSGPNEARGFTAGGELQRARTENRAALTPKQRMHAKVLDVMRRALPRDAFIAADSTQLAYTGSQVFPALAARGWLYPVGYGTLGFALPAAIGAKLAAPTRPGCVIIGDGGLLFTVQELATAVDLKIALPIVLWNNDAYGQIKDDMGAKGFPQIGVDLRNPDFLMLARAFGCMAERPESLEAIGTAIEAALRRDVPTLIEVREDASFLG
ncbi:MAG: 5-guanidino-2-oxopentanoate decarboxylase [Alphaproteobacteria bacterium]|nr:5-guanidino-2-oxopentanoate decarboxylase [Alphaproteobacteria bacterium]